MADHVANRDKIIKALMEELVGPSPQGECIDCTGTISFESKKEFYKPRVQKGSGEEILQRDKPTARYGAGVLYPLEIPVEQDDNSSGLNEIEDNDANKGMEENQTDSAEEGIHKIQERAKIKASTEEDSDDFELSTANSFRPSSMGISFLAEFPEDSVLVVEVTGGKYYKKNVRVGTKNYNWWLRVPVKIRAEFKASSICEPGKELVKASYTANTSGLDLRIEVFSRQGKEPGTRLLTTCIVNRTGKNKSNETLADDICLFQTKLEARVLLPGNKESAYILPYPGPDFKNLDDEEQSLALLYRNAETFAIGHGCAANWEVIENVNKAKRVCTEVIPTCEIPSITPDIERDDGTPIKVPMAPLAGLVEGDDGFSSLEELITLYKKWVDERKHEIPKLEGRYKKAATRHMEECERCYKRMKEGLEYLKENPKAMRAFQLANHAMLLQQAQARRSPRLAKYNNSTSRYVFLEEYKEPDPVNPGTGKGNWRAFQVAFLLMALKSAAEGNIPDRDTVELIWFPTGGGKTEAYLGLAAFSMFYRRLVDKEDAGVSVIMRYTLRLLTAQQFQRASTLTCVMDYLRRRNMEELGEQEFSIGIWLGGSTTPNTRGEAITCLSKLNNSKHEKNLFVLDRCPWCGAQMGRFEGKIPKKAPVPRVLGYVRQGNTVVFKCPDTSCEFKDGLPVYVIDEDIYDKRPTLLIGTVDKFAMLAWKPQARAIFGIGPGGERLVSPPGLIIQDELHLISGPLGSMVGIYETIIEELCTDRRQGLDVKPKIVSSTATIRRYQQQVKALYGRENVVLFPPPGLDASDSFFARHARDSKGKLLPGKIYAGVHAPGLRSMQTAQVRTFTALLQAPVPLDKEERDPWWTLLLFFNSLRELGTTLTLFQSDIPNHLQVMQVRLGNNPGSTRQLWNILELTSRLRGDQVPEAISQLEKSTTRGKYPVDVCLASNIIEVGVDIDRLSLMCVVGQPKTTSQYIQVTGRVGRKWRERPGLVVTLYSPSKPRDRSHYEKFRSYHERLYAQVEPTSVTPFSPPALDRALHAVMVSYARQAGDEDLANRPYPYPAEMIDQLREIILKRVKNIDKDELEYARKVFNKRAREWKEWEKTEWEGSSSPSDVLLRVAGSYATLNEKKLTWGTPMSMRDVDAECRAVVTNLYKLEGGGEDE